MLVTLEEYNKMQEVASKHSLKVVLLAKQGEKYNHAINLEDWEEWEPKGEEEGSKFASPDESDSTLWDNTGNGQFLHRGIVPEGQAYVSIEGKNDLSDFWDEVGAR